MNITSSSKFFYLYPLDSNRFFFVKIAFIKLNVHEAGVEVVVVVVVVFEEVAVEVVVEEVEVVVVAGLVLVDLLDIVMEFIVEQDMVHQLEEQHIGLFIE
jgi:hypothetical protein